MSGVKYVFSGAFTIEYQLSKHLLPKQSCDCSIRVFNFKEV